MRNFYASAVERRIVITKALASHPMEAGWASEAIFFLLVEEVDGENTELNARVDISVDGINWIDEGTAFQPIDKPGHYFARVKHFGNWLRVSGILTGKSPRIKLSVHLHLKE